MAAAVAPVPPEPLAAGPAESAERPSADALPPPGHPDRLERERPFWPPPEAVPVLQAAAPPDLPQFAAHPLPAHRRTGAESPRTRKPVSVPAPTLPELKPVLLPEPKPLLALRPATGPVRPALPGLPPWKSKAAAGSPPVSPQEVPAGWLDVK